MGVCRTKTILAAAISGIQLFNMMAPAFAEQDAAAPVIAPAEVLPGKTAKAHESDPCADQAKDGAAAQGSADSSSQAADNVKSEDEQEKIVLESSDLDNLDRIDPRAPEVDKQFAQVYKRKIVKGIFVRVLFKNRDDKWGFGPAVSLARLNDAGYFTSVRHRDCFGRTDVSPTGKSGRCDEVTLVCPSGKDIPLLQAEDILFRFKEIERREAMRLYAQIQKGDLIAALRASKPEAVLADGELDQRRQIEAYTEAQPKVSYLRWKAYLANMNSSMDAFDLWNKPWEKLEYLYLWNDGLRPAGNWWRNISSQELRQFITNSFIDYTQSIVNIRVVHNFLQAITEGLYALVRSIVKLSPDTSDFEGAWRDFGSTCVEAVRPLINMPLIAVPTELVMKYFDGGFYPTGDFAKDWVGPKLGLNLNKRPAGLAETVQLIATALGLDNMGPVTAVPLGRELPFIPAVADFLEQWAFNLGMFLPIPSGFSFTESIVGPLNAAPEIDAKEKTVNDIEQMKRDQVNQFAEENLHVR